MTAPATESRVHVRLWEALLAADRPVHVGYLHAAADTSFQTADYRVGLWVDAGLVERTGRRPHRYQLHPQTRRTSMPPIITCDRRAVARKPAAYDRMWFAIRTLRTFDLPMLRMIAETSYRSASGYIGLLQRCGYVRMTSLGNPRLGECASYRLVRNTGRIAPRETIVVVDGGDRRELVDGNTGERHDVSRGTPSRRRSYHKAAPVDGGVG